MTTLLLLLVTGYLLGSLSGSLLLGRLRGVDIRSHGSGNAGGTNALRTLGWRFALAVVAIDIGKGALAAALGWNALGWNVLGWNALGWNALGWDWHAPSSVLDPQAQALACGLAAVAGHTWPLFFGFRGGKGAGTLVGALLVAWPLAVPALLAVWLLVLVATGYVGLATVLAAVTLLPLAWLLPGTGRVHDVFAVVAAAFIVFTHRGNLARLRAGTEQRFERVRVWRRRPPP